MYNSYGIVLSKEHANSGSIFVDHASDYIFYFTQTSIKGKQTAEGKYKFKTFAKSYNIKIKYYYANNRIFNSQVFKESYIIQKQTQSFYRVNAHYQNGIVERKIKTLISLARVILFNAIIK